MLMLNRIPNPMLFTGSLGDILTGIMTRTIGYKWTLRLLFES